MPVEQAANPLVQLPIIPYILIFVIFYFLVIKPNKDKQKEQKNMIANLKKNDEIVTAGGIHGTIVMIKDKTIVVRIDEKTKIELEKDSVSTVLKQRTKE